MGGGHARSTPRKAPPACQGGQAGAAACTPHAQLGASVRPRPGPAGAGSVRCDRRPLNRWRRYIVHKGMRLGRACCPERPTLPGPPCEPYQTLNTRCAGRAAPLRFCIMRGVSRCRPPCAARRRAAAAERPLQGRPSQAAAMRSHERVRISDASARSLRGRSREARAAVGRAPHTEAAQCRLPCGAACASGPARWLRRPARARRAGGGAEGGGARAARAAERRQRRGQAAAGRARGGRAGERGGGRARGRARGAGARGGAEECVCLHRAQPLLARLCAPAPLLRAPAACRGGVRLALCSSGCLRSDHHARLAQQGRH